MTASNPRINKLINTIKKSGVVDKDKSMGKDTKESLWANIRARRAAGKRKLKPGDKNYPKTLDIEAKNEMMTTADAGIPQDTKTMGPKLKTTYMHDRRRKKSELPVLLKRFRKYMEDDSK